MKKILIQIISIILAGLLLIVISSFPFYNLMKDNFSADLFILHLAVVICLFLGILVSVIVFLYTKRADIRLAKKSAYFGKPYLIKIDANGLIEEVNATCLVNIKDIGKYVSVEQFDCFKENVDLMNEIKMQKPFTACFEAADNGVLYLRFLPVKSRRKYYLIGENISTQQLNFDFHRNLSLHSPITNYPNRNFFGIKLQELFDDKKEIRKANSLALIDISGFKNINKLFGYKIADETLKVLAKLIDESVWDYQADVFHVGDDVFLVFFRNTEKSDVETWGEFFLEELKNPVTIAGNHFNIEVNIGVFHIEIDKYPDLNPVQAYENALLALSKAKDSKKTNLVVYEESFSAALKKSKTVEIDLQEALKNHELYLKFQPQVNNLDNKVVGFEALLRWNNPKYQFWSPAKFIEIIKENALLLEIGRFVLEETLRFSQEVAPYGIQVSCNISPFQLLHRGFVSELLAAYDKYQLKPKQICLEVTENNFIECHQDLFENLLALKNKGYSIRLDNFGTGYSSMLYLDGFPIDGISIHREYVRTVLTDKYSRKNVLNIIGLAKSLDLEVFGEGVENEEQNQFLRENGCHIIQGYFYGRALNREDALAYVKKSRE